MFDCIYHTVYANLYPYRRNSEGTVIVKQPVQSLAHICVYKSSPT